MDIICYCGCSHVSDCCGRVQGKIVDVLSKDVDIVARCQGGSNAGHTIKVHLDDEIH
jgi:adenylosuccinate synthase